MVKILFIQSFTFLFFTIPNSCKKESLINDQVTPKDFKKISIINQRYFHKYPGTDQFLNAISEKPDTMVFYDSENISIMIDQAPFDDNEGIIKYDSKIIHILDKKRDSIFMLIPNYTQIIRKSKGDSIWNKLYEKSSYNLTKSTQSINEKFNPDKNILTLYFDTTGKPNTGEEISLSSIDIHFLPEIKNNKFSISNYYDSLGYGKVVFIEFKVAAFYSNMLKKNIEAFNFYNQIIFHGNVTEEADLKFINSVLEKGKIHTLMHFD